MRSKIILIIALLAAACCPLSAKTETDASKVENVNLRDRRQFVYDPSGALSPEATAQINAKLYALRQQTTAEGAVVIVPELTNQSLEEFSQEVFSNYGLGKSDKSNGFLITVVLGSHDVRIQTGRGLEGVMPDVVCGRIIRQDFIPLMRSSGLGAALTATVDRISLILTDPAAAEEIRSGKADYQREGDEDPIPIDYLVNFFLIVVALMFLFGMGHYIYNSSKARRMDPYHKTMYWRSQLGTLKLAAIASAGLALPFYLLARGKEKRIRNRPLVCSTCGAKMAKLGEEEDNALLNSAQDLEERLNTVDYDVWECPRCGTIERYAYPTKQTKYTDCPKCGTKAMSLVSSKVEIPATTKRAGVGVKTYECQYCHHRREDRYKIPRKEDPAAAAAAMAAGAILSGGRGGRGGGGFGGGFGGGSSAGGGASGRW